MNKKFLSAILFGALMITSTGTFVSCKDYDDDIENLQEQINNLATKADVEAKLAQLQTALAAAQADAAKALAEAKAADDSAEIAALQAKIDAFKSCTCDVEAMMAEIKDATDAQMAEYKAEIEALIEKTEDLVGEIASLVTDVELILTDGVDGSTTLPFITATQVKNEGWGPNKELTFTEDAQTNFGGSIVARVSPTNAVPTASSISFINSKGDDLSALIEVGTPKKFEGVLARAAETGLWEIPYDVKSYTAASLASAKMVDPYDASKGKLLYALAINNMSSNEEGIRNVVSGYDLTIADDLYLGTDALYFKAGGKLVTDLKNRNGANGLTEYKWAANQPKANRVSIKSDKTNVVGDTDDNRVIKSYLSVKVGVPFDVVLTDEAGKALPANKKAYRFYVTLDKAYAEANSEPSEINVWNSYAANTTGLNVLDTDGKVTITINDATAEGDIIGYRVYAVNYDGTVVDPDGKAFYVYVGNPTAAAANLTLAVTPPYNWNSFKSTTKADFSTANWGRATTYGLAVTDPSANNADVTGDLGITKSNFVFYNADGATVALPSTDVVKVEMVGVNPANLKDGVTYVATFTAKNGKGVVATATVSFTKQLPEFPSSVVYPFTNVLQNNVLHIYPIANADATRAQYNMTNVWHGLVAKGTWTSALAAATSFDQVLTEDEAKLVADGKYPTINYSSSSQKIGVDAKLLDPNNSNATKPYSNYYLTEFPVNVTYDYGQISYPYMWTGTQWAWVQNQTWKPVGNEIKMVFRNYAADLNIAWEGEVPTLYYPGKENVTDSIALDKIKVTDWYGKTVDLSKDNDYFTAANVDIKLLTGDNNEVDEYYEAEIKAAKTYGKTNVPAQIIFTSKVKQSQGTPVPTTIKVVITDKFGYEVSKSGLAPFSMSFTK